MLPVLAVLVLPVMLGRDVAVALPWLWVWVWVLQLTL